MAMEGVRRRGAGGGSDRPSGIHLGWVLVCLFCFVGGSFFGRRLGRTSQLQQLEPQQSQELVVDRLLMEEQDGGSHQLGGAVASDVEQQEQQEPSVHAGSKRRQFATFEEMLEESGMLADRPPLHPGASGHDFYTVQPMQLLSWYPRAYLLPKFIDPERAAHIVELAETRLTPSGLALKPGEKYKADQDIRTSSGTFLTRQSDPEGALAWVEDKIAAVTGIPPGHGEPFNVLRYDIGQHYDSHYDSFNEEDYGPQSNQRIATVLLYLSDVEEGGETVFLLEGEEGLDRLRTIDYKACDTGIKVKPRLGDALLFWSTHVNGTVDKRSLHGSCPVTKGLKYTMTKWIRNKCFMADCVNV